METVPILNTLCNTKTIVSGISRNCRHWYSFL